VDVKWKSRAESAEGTFGDPCHEKPAEPGYSDRVSWLIRGRYGMSLPSVTLGTLSRHTPRFLVEGGARAFIFEVKVRDYGVY